MSLKIPPVCDKTYYSAVLVICTEQKGMKINMKLRVISFIKRETILTVSFFLGLLSCFLQSQTGVFRYFTSNMGTMIILFCLMAVVAGLKSAFRVSGESGFGTDPGPRGRDQQALLCFCVFLAVCLLPMMWR